MLSLLLSFLAFLAPLCSQPLLLSTLSCSCRVRGYCLASISLHHFQFASLAFPVLKALYICTIFIAINGSLCGTMKSSMFVKSEGTKIHLREENNGLKDQEL